jgi:4-hydroxybenzoate polyprenyltransferase
MTERLATETKPTMREGRGSFPVLVFRELRVRQWTKNMVLFAGVVFARQFGDPIEIRRAAAAFIAFCFYSSFIYVLNDIIDVENDRIHPKKRNRPIASGAISMPVAWVMLAVLLAAGGAIGWRLGPHFGVVALAYLALMVLYTVGLKRIVMVDVMVISIGFVLRAVAGVAVLLNPAELSPWLLLCTFFLALFLAVGKRRNERILLAEQAEHHRRTLAEYPPELIDQLIPVVTAATVISYSIYTVTPATIERVGSSMLVYTVPLVVFGVFRYLYLVFRRSQGGSPSETLLTDPPTLINVVIWLGVVLWILYGGK